MEVVKSASTSPVPAETPFLVEPITATDQRFPGVIALWGTERKTLGLFPVGAFEACAAANHLLVAATSNGIVCGYLAYRVQRRLNSAVIIHLCVDRASRGKGVSDALWERLKNDARKNGWDSVRLKCRRDYRVHPLWERFGCVARKDVAGRSQSGSELTVWIYNLKGQDLFTLAGTDDDGNRLRVVIDANVFFDLCGKNINRNEESDVLLEPWMDEVVTLCVVDEIHNEIDRQANSEAREFYHQKAQQFRELEAPGLDFEKAYEAILSILGDPGKSASNRSDRKQVAKAAAAKADVFLTRDEDLLAAAAEIEGKFALRVLSPGELSSKLDEAERAHVYQPARLAGTQLIQRAVRAADLDAIVSAFQAAQAGETRNQLVHPIRESLAQIRASDAHEMQVVWEDESNPLAFIGRIVDRARAETEIRFLRLNKSRLERTLARHLLLVLVRQNCDEGLNRIRITDKHLGPAVIEALHELSFSVHEGLFERLTPAIIGERAMIARHLEELESERTAAGQSSPACISTLSPEAIEERYWPAKVTGEELPNYIIPIKATWAAQLFDPVLARSELFGAFARLALNRENVYYRSARSAGLVAPARIIWYVCQDAGAEGTMAMRACSRLLSLETGPAKELFKRHQRIGIYQWRDILETADGNPFNAIMAIRFADSEPFTQVVPVEFVRNLGINSQFQSPTRITEEQFIAIYRHGMKTKTA
jgi:predicted nucleic acid-binding protein/GNAT superfamily N-acetyltransferase